jgi:hypothetical protein
VSAVTNALAFADMGHAVLPIWGIVDVPSDTGTDHVCACPKGADCTSPGKHPLARLVPRGLKDGTTDAATIKRWADNAPDCNWAVSTDGLVVLDQDGPKGRSSLQKLQKDYHQLPPTWRVSTGRMQSQHFYFKAPEGVEIGNSAGKLGKGLDVRAVGGYVVIPGSAHVTGFPYSWWKRHHPNDANMAVCPRWLVALLAEPKNGGPRPPDYYRELAAAQLQQGERNCTLAKLAGHLLANCVELEVAHELLQGWNRGRCKPPLSAAEVEHVVVSIASREYRKRGIIK